ncbi:MAG TPA: MarR family transcriptional regulator, partial [Bdellovibrionota bacterium]|nr:MarR family transcriptional regulator [Bdellovibrionota bacterium]
MYQHDKYNRILFSFINRLQETEEQAFQNEKLSRDLTYTEVHVVYELGKYHEPQAMNVIAQDLGITQSSLTSLVDKIEKKGYLQRIREESDRRLVCLELTKKGHRLNQFHTDYHKNLVQKIHEILTETEMDSLFANLQKL